MKIAYILFDGITSLDFFGIYDPVSRLKSMAYLPELEWDICGIASRVKDNFGLQITVEKISPHLGKYDAIVVPGGFGTRDLQNDMVFIEWIKTAQTVPFKISICTGSLILGAAGFLSGKKCTTHFNEYDALATYTDKVKKEHIVEDGDVITAGAVAASLDLGLYLCEKWAGTEARQQIAKSMNYKGALCI
ncbi:MAG: DJ-1/PfpI family protein [Flavobacteriaceae bacterium]